jgi:O-antigen/teichoic acid export membrane protein
METDELKASWGILNERLEKNEILNKRIIEEMILSRTQTAYNKLFRFEIKNIVIIGLVCLLLPLIHPNNRVFTPISLRYVEGVMFFSLIVQVFIASFLFRFKIETKKFSQLSKLLLDYKLWSRRNYVYGSGLGLLFLCIFILLQDYFPSVFYAFFGGSLGLSFLLTYWMYKFQKKNISAIEKGLAELKELEQELPA